jgi:hypothetical protein
MHDHRPLPHDEHPRSHEVVFCNFDDGSYLFLDASGVFMTCSEDRATRFLLSKVVDSNKYIIEGRNSLSQMVRNKSQVEIKKIIDKSIERQGSRASLEIELEVFPVEDSYITIQLELGYAKRALAYNPSLHLIKTIFDELIYYGILDFARDPSIINQHLEQLLL